MYQIIFSEQKIFESRKNIWKTPFVVYVGFVNNICGRMFYGLMKPNVNFINTIVKVFRAQKQHRASLEKKVFPPSWQNHLFQAKKPPVYEIATIMFYCSFTTGCLFTWMALGVLSWWRK